MKEANGIRLPKAFGRTAPLCITFRFHATIAITLLAQKYVQRALCIKIPIQGSFDADKCIGCGYCAMACPYGAPTVDRDLKHSVKCDGCASRVAEGKNPICTEACLLRCLYFGDKDEMAQKGELAALAPLPDSSYTEPNLYIREPLCAKPSGDTSGHVANPKEVE